MSPALRPSRVAIVGVALLTWCAGVASASPRAGLVHDLLHGQGPSGEYLWGFVEFAPVADGLVFRAWDGVHGWEPWRTDGTADGTRLLLDICPGDCSSSPFELRALLGQVYFTARDGDHGEALWRTDGTTAGTQLVADVSTRVWPQFTLAFLTEFDGALYFTAEDADHGSELWRSDGEPGGAVELVADVRPGPEGSEPASLFVVGETLYFTADDGAVGREPWKSDGTAAGTELVMDFCPGPADCFWQEQLAPPAGPWIFARAGERLLLKTSGDRGAVQLWSTDGTAAGSVLLGALDGVEVFPFPAADGAVLFSGHVGLDYALWRSDGTIAGTYPLASILTSPAVGAAGGKVYFGGPAADGVGLALWSTDGTAQGTARVADPGAGSAPGVSWALFALRPRAGEDPLVYFPADDGVTGGELWRSDGTTEGTFLLADTSPGPASGFYPLYTPVFAGELDGHLLFFAITPGSRFELWSTDGSTAGTSRLAELDLQASAMERTWRILGSDMAALDDAALFVADDGVHGRELWRARGDPPVPRLVLDTCPNCIAGPRDLTQVGERVFFVVTEEEGAGENHLWVSDGTPVGTTLVESFSSDFYTYALTAWNHPQLGPRALFVHWGPYLSDGTPEGTYALGGGYGYEPTPAGPRVFFASGALDSGTELWASAGQPNDAVRVADIAPGEASSFPQRLTALGSRVIFSADDGLSGREPWISDGTEPGTSLLADVRPGPEGSIPDDVEIGGQPYGGAVYFPADDGLSGLELWRADGTAAGTERVADVHAGPEGSDPDPGSRVRTVSISAPGTRSTDASCG